MYQHDQGYKNKHNILYSGGGCKKFFVLFRVVYCYVNNGSVHYIVINWGIVVKEIMIIKQG